MLNSNSAVQGKHACANIMAQKLFLTTYQPQEMEALFMNWFMRAFETHSNKQPPALPDDWVTAKQAAARLRISRPTLTRLVREGHLKAFRLGRNLRFKTADVQSALQSISSIKYSRRGQI